MEMENKRLKKLTDDSLVEVAGGLEVNPPLKASMIVDKNVAQKKELEDSEKHEIES